MLGIYMRRNLIQRLMIIGLALCLWQSTTAAEKIDFNHQIKPLLSDRCFTCHGPDEKSRKAKLRLDTQEGAFGTSKAKAPIIKKGAPDQSELFQRLISHDEEEKMPPPESNLALTREEI